VTATILHVDRDPDSLRFVRRALEAQNFRVISSHDGPEGLRRTAAHDPDLVLLDMSMPGLSCAATMAALLADNPRRRIMVLGTGSDTATKIKCLDAGAVDVLSKPFDIGELLARVRAHLRSAAATVAPPTEEIVCGPLRLNLRTRRLITASREIDLPQREFALLEYFMRRPGNACTRAELLAQVWGYVFDPGSNVVDVTIARLRSKLVGARIETVRNVGYALQLEIQTPVVAETS
jgi:two-component system, OmpR family, response regulator